MQGKKIKIAHIVEGFEGGVSTYLCNVLPGLVREGFDVLLIYSLKRHCPPASEKIEELRRRGVKVRIISMQRELNVFKDAVSFFVLLWVMLIGRFDIIHTHCSKAGAVGRAAAFLAGVPVRLHSAHCFAFLRTGGRFRKWLYRFVERALGAVTKRFIAVSRAEADIAVDNRIFGRERIDVIRNGLPLAAMGKGVVSRESLGLRDDTRVVVTACRLVEYKGMLRFLEAARVCAADNTVFLVAGEGPLRGEMEAYVSERGLEGKVKLLGYVGHMGKLYSICDAVVLCSDSEGQPYVLLEAMRAGCCAVATDVGGNRELLEEGCGVLVEASGSAVARGIESVLGDKRQARECAENGRRRFLANHLLERQVLQLVDTYQGCLVDAEEEYAGDRVAAS